MSFLERDYSSTYIRINSTDRDSKADNRNNFSLTLPPSNDTFDRVVGVQVSSVDIVHSFYNVLRNYEYFTWGLRDLGTGVLHEYECTLTPGFYSASELGTALKASMNVTGHFKDRAQVSTIVVDTTGSKRTVTMTFGPGLDAGTYPQANWKPEVFTTYGRSPNAINEINTILGAVISDHTHSNVVVAHTPPNWVIEFPSLPSLNSNASVVIHCNQLGKNTGSTAGNVLTGLITVPLGEWGHWTHYEPQDSLNNVLEYDTPRSISNLSFRLTDVLGRPVETHGLDWSCVIKFYYDN